MDSTSFKIIAFSGAAGSGKSTAANHLQARYGFAPLAFAGPLKAALNAMFGWDPQLWENREWKERVLPDIGKSPRQLAQTLGTEWGRDLVNRDLWLILAKQAVDRVRHIGLPGVVFTDCRFENEAEFVRSMGGKVVQIFRPHTATVAEHVSERCLPTSLRDFHYFNVGTIVELHTFARSLVEDTIYDESGTAVGSAGKYTWRDSL